MNLFVFIANAWGPVSGGINSFNYDLTIACARNKKNDKTIKICCVVPGLTECEKKMIKKEGIIPITLSKEAFGSSEAVRLISENLLQQNKLRHYYPRHCNTFCIGHDIYTGELSRCLADQCDGWNVVFHHMDYTSYYLLKTPDIDRYQNKIKLQKTTLQNADLICAVGPMLAQSAQDMSRGADVKTIEVLPGLAEFSVMQEKANRFSSIVFGRVEENNKIKQISLAIDAFAKAIEQDKDTSIIGNNSTLNVIGYENDDPTAFETEIRRLQENANIIAGRLCNIVPYPYITDREVLGEKLCMASVAMMLSFHEGFGLVGYEAIAAGVPLILSQNSGLYMFLQQEGLDHFIYPIDIEGSTDSRGYSQNDLTSVARALRDIRQSEDKYKEKALTLLKKLRSEKDKYSWEAVANNFIDSVLNEFDTQLKNESTVFYRPEELTKININSCENGYENIIFNPSAENHIFSVEGKNALLLLNYCLKKKFSEKYSVYIYYMQSEKEGGFQYSDFLNDCRVFFGKESDITTPEFKYVLSERLNDTILILDNFPTSPVPEFNDLFSLLNMQKHNFYIFTVFENDSPTMITLHNKGSFPRIQEITDAKMIIPGTLTNEHRLLVKVLSFRDRMGYSKKLIKYICNGINRYYDMEQNSQVFEDVAKIEEDLVKYGFVEEYSEFSYQNSNICLTSAAEFKVEREIYALGISKLGRFYARCYHLNRDRDAHLYWGYFSCKCFAYAASMSDKIKKDIKNDYETILIAMRKKAIDISDYGRYIQAIQSFIDEYEKPDNLWIWYNLIHCETICCPQMKSLKKAESILNSELRVAKAKIYKGDELEVQLIRLCAELEYELNVPNSLNHLIERVAGLSSTSKVGTAWMQCLSTLVNLAIDQKEYILAKEYLYDYKRITKLNNMYSKVIAVAMETNLKIAQYVEGVECDLSTVLPNIQKAFYIARNTLKDYRAQGWTLGLWGECQILLKDCNGEKNVLKSIKYRKSSGEKTKEYRNWLQRISRYDLQQSTKQLLNEEIHRTDIKVCK